jgi:hypothetical protein
VALAESIVRRLGPQALAESMEVSCSEMTKGFKRMGEAVEDLSLDVPGAREMFTAFVARAKEEHILE